MSSAFSLGEPITSPIINERDPEADAEFSEVIDSMKKSTVEDMDPVSRRPTRPHHSAEGNRPEHPISAEGEKQPEKSAEAEEVIMRSCLFCNLQSESIDDNVAHMERTHGLFVPERPYLVDLEGLISHLHERVDILHECLYCGNVRPTTAGIQTHMRDKGHCMIAFESEEEMVEVGQFYDFRSTYSDEEDEDENDAQEDSQNGVKLGAKRDASFVVQNGDDIEMRDGADDDWEDEDAESSDGTEVANNSTTSSRRKARSSNNQPFTDGYELHLPTGRIAGHRSLAKYFRQNLAARPTEEERGRQLAIANDDSDAMEDGERERTSAQSETGRQLISRADGGLGMLAAPLHKKREARATEIRERKRDQRAQTRYQWGNEKRANMQKHYRDPLLQ